jgi:alkanesulfonate monooxygenase SsuD/methylene tetrahydromethanopterin reductase-like flavin-dependent oxidoreductase (luciferase family)
MKIGVGLPSAITDTRGMLIADWARRAEELGFASVAVIDRLMAPTFDPLATLAAAAAVTSEIELYTSVLLSPLRSAAMVASQVATVDQISGGRLRLGLGVGSESRRRDYEAVGVPFGQRGRILDEQLAQLRQAWSGMEAFAEPGPRPFSHGGPPILLGGTSVAAQKRVIQHGTGWICGLGGAPAFSRTADVLRKAWHRADRAGRPKLMSLTYFALGSNAELICGDFVRGYYGNAPFAETLLHDTPTTPDGVRAVVNAHRNVGCDHLLLFPCEAAGAQLELLGEVLERDLADVALAGYDNRFVA